MSGLGVLFGEESRSIEKIIKPESNKAINTADNKAIKRATRALDKEKATFNLSKKLLQEIEDAWIEIRKLRGDKKVSKTDIVEFSLNQLLTDFRSTKQESKLYCFIANNKNVK